MSILPTQLISGAVVLQAEAVRLAHPFLPSPVLLVRTWRDDGFPPALSAQSVRAGTEEQSKAVLLRHALQEAPQGSVAFLTVTVLGDCWSLGAGHDILWPQRATFLVQAAVLSCLQTLVLAVHRERGSWRVLNRQMYVRNRNHEVCFMCVPDEVRALLYLPWWRPCVTSQCFSPDLTAVLRMETPHTHRMLKTQWTLSYELCSGELD